MVGGPAPGQGLIEPPGAGEDRRSGSPVRRSNNFHAQQPPGGGGDMGGQGIIGGQGVIETEEESQKKFRWAFGWGDHALGDAAPQQPPEGVRPPRRTAAEEDIALDEMLEELSTNSLNDGIELADHIDVDEALRELNQLHGEKDPSKPGWVPQPLSSAWACCVQARTKAPLPYVGGCLDRPQGPAKGGTKGQGAPLPGRQGGGAGKGGGGGGGPARAAAKNGHPGGGKPAGVGKPPAKGGGLASQMAQQKPLLKVPPKASGASRPTATPRGKGFVWKDLWSPAV